MAITSGSGPTANNPSPAISACRTKNFLCRLICGSKDRGVNHNRPRAGRGCAAAGSHPVSWRAGAGSGLCTARLFDVPESGSRPPVDTVMVTGRGPDRIGTTPPPGRVGPYPPIPGRARERRPRPRETRHRGKIVQKCCRTRVAGPARDRNRSVAIVPTSRIYKYSGQ